MQVGSSELFDYCTANNRSLIMWVKAGLEAIKFWRFLKLCYLNETLDR